jgi:hypothetical protein
MQDVLILVAVYPGNRVRVTITFGEVENLVREEVGLQDQAMALFQTGVYTNNG